MKRLLLGGLSIILGLLVVKAHAEEIQWRPVPSRTVKQYHRPPVAAAPAAATGQPTSPASLGQPAMLQPAARPNGTTGVLPVGFSQGNSRPAQPFQLTSDSQQTFTSSPVGNATDEPPTAPGNTDIIPLPQPSQRKSNSPSGPAVPGGIPYDGAYPDGGGAGPIAPDWPGCPDGLCVPQECWGDGYHCCLPRFYGNAEYLLWAIKGGSLPPLATSTTLSPAQIEAMKAADPNFQVGALGQLGTVPVFGGGNGNNGHFPLTSGGRFTLGMSGPCRQYGLETTFFFLGQTTRTFAESSPGSPALFRPYYDVTQGLESAEFVAFPNLLKGSVNVSNPLRLWGIGVNVRKKWLCGCNYYVDLLGGFRYLDLQERLAVAENLTFTRSATATVDGRTVTVTKGDNIQIQDHFEVRNRFYGGQVGADFQYRLGRWIFGVNAKVALGTMNQTAHIFGNTAFNLANGNQYNANQGFLAQPTNSGWFSRDHFAVVPEIGLKIGYQITKHLSVYAGYNFLYVSNVLRSGDLIDRGVNTTQLPSIVNGQLVNGQLQGPARPAFVFRSTDFWAQGLMAGLQLRY